MFDAFLKVKQESMKNRYMRTLETNASFDNDDNDDDDDDELAPPDASDTQNGAQTQAKKRSIKTRRPLAEMFRMQNPHARLQDLIDIALSDDNFEKKPDSTFICVVKKIARVCVAVRDSALFSVRSAPFFRSSSTVSNESILF